MAEKYSDEWWKSEDGQKIIAADSRPAMPYLSWEERPLWQKVFIVLLLVAALLA